jgi:hypothetical protein
LTACGTIGPYHPSSSQQAKLKIDIPYKYSGDAKILVVKDKNYFTDYSTLFEARTNSGKLTELPIDAGKPLLLNVIYSVNATLTRIEYCDMKASFTPEPNQRYVLIVGDEPGEDRGFLKELLTGPTAGTCLMTVAQRVGGKFIPVTLEKF